MGAGRGRRTGIILILLIIVVLVIGIGVLFVMQGLGGGGGGGAAAEPTAPPPTAPPTVNVLVAARDLPRGARLTVQDVTVIAWPILENAPPPFGALILSNDEGAPGLEQVEGRIARVDILNGQPVLDFMLTPGQDPTALSDTGSDAALLIPSGQVAYSIPISRLSSVAYAIREGDHVDLLMSFRFVDVDEDFQTILPNDSVVLVQTGDTLTQDQLPVGRQEDGPLGTTLVVVPSANDGTQRPRQATQLVIDNAMVLRVGEWPLSGLNEPIVVTPAPAPTQSSDQQSSDQAEATPLPTAIPAPEVVTLVMSRQDALVLKYALETGAAIDMALRSALDDDINDIVTDTVSLQYIIDFYNIAIPPRLPVAQDPRIDGSSLPDTGAEASPTPVP